MALCAVDVLLGCSSFTDELAVAVHSVTVSSVISWQFAGRVLLCNQNNYPNVKRAMYIITNSSSQIKFIYHSMCGLIYICSQQYMQTCVCVLFFINHCD